MAERGAGHDRLLKDLRQQVVALEDDLREVVEREAGYRAALDAEYQQARKAERTGATYETWRDERLTQVAVAWALSTVFVRFCEDNRLIESPWIAGPGDRLRDAEDRHDVYFRQHPEKNDRDWLVAAFDHMADTNPTVAGLFNRDHNPLWEVEPSYEAASALLNFWRRRGPDGGTVHDFTDRSWDTRFLGDLYQDLSEHARKTYALLQTPEFVEEFILDLTLEPAVKEFGLEPVTEIRAPNGDITELHGLRTIDPACGSGHFLLGTFHRLLDHWTKEAPNLDQWDLIRRALKSVHGCDKNPFAVAIARFRLLLAALRAAGETRLDRAPAFPLNIAVGDSLLHGRDVRRPTESLFSLGGMFYYATEDVDDFAVRCDLLGLHSYHVVVGNPPYITVKDKQENKNYRGSYRSCAGAYALSVPFAQRIFELAIRDNGSQRTGGFTGQITANSFMKREFGKKLIEDFFSSIELSHIIDTSGAFIPGHGTPTVILIGRNHNGRPDQPIRAVLGIRGEPSQPGDPAKGFVWSAIVNQVNEPGTESDWVTVADLPRTQFMNAPWSLGGGGAGDLRQALESSAMTTLSANIRETGFGAVSREDDAYVLGTGALRRSRIDKSHQRCFVDGDTVRDFTITAPTTSLWPYDEQNLMASAPKAIIQLLWPIRVILRGRVAFGRTQLERGLTWYEYSMFFNKRYRVPLSITFAFVATHNHFVLDRGGKVFNRSAPVIKLAEGAGEDEHLALLGLLNSSAACFWLKQVCHDKGIRGEGGGLTSNDWERFFEFTGTKLQEFPLPAELPLDLGRALDGLAQRLADQEPAAVCAAQVPDRAVLDAARTEYEQIRGRMVASQEELDWQVYGLYGLLAPEEIARTTAEHLDAVPEVMLGERAFEIVLARQIAAGEADSEWFSRHGSTPVTEIPAHWPEEYRRIVQARIDLIERRRDLALIERAECKRRWAADPWEKKERAALRAWLLDRCEREELWYARRDGIRQPRTLTVNQLADQFRDDADMHRVAALYASDHLGKRDMPLASILEQVVADEHVPYLAALRYKDTGLRKRAQWEKVWELQREEDRADTRLDIALPPKYTSADFRRNSYWIHRGKLDVPKEQFISYPGASPDSDPTLLLGWAGWDHQDRAQALVNLVNDRTEQAAWDPDRLAPLLAGLLELMPWVKQWHGEYDARWEGVPAEEFQAFLDDQRARHQFAEADLRAWLPVAASGRRRAADRPAAVQQTLDEAE